MRPSFLHHLVLLWPPQRQLHKTVALWGAVSDVFIWKSPFLYRWELETWRFSLGVDSRPAGIQASCLLPVHAVLTLPSLVLFYAFCLEKGWVALFFPPLPVSLHLIYIIQLGTHGWLVDFYSGDLTWAVFGESGIFRKEEFCFCSFLFRQEFYFGFDFCDCVGCHTLFENILVGLCVRPVTVTPS